MKDNNECDGDLEAGLEALSLDITSCLKRHNPGAVLSQVGEFIGSWQANAVKNG